LEDEIEGKAEFELADHDGAWLLALERDQVAAAYLALDIEAELFGKRLTSR
jgi:hypothetical protein